MKSKAIFGKRRFAILCRSSILTASSILMEAALSLKVPILTRLNRRCGNSSLARPARGDEKERPRQANLTVWLGIGREGCLGFLDDGLARRLVGLFLVEEPAGGSEHAGVLGFRRCRSAEDMKRPLVDPDFGKPRVAQNAAHIIGVAERHRPRRVG